MDDLSAQKDWLDKERKKIGAQGVRRQKRQYLHFDKRISIIDDDLARRVLNPDAVASYSFYPFVRSVRRSRLYKRVPGRRVKKIKAKERPIDYAAHYDALIFSWYTYQLSALYERRVIELGVSDNVIAYRQLGGKSNLDFAKEVFDFIKAHPGYVAITVDVEKFFENLDHAMLKLLWKELLEVGELPEDHYAIFKAVTQFRYVDIAQLRRVLGFRAKDQGHMDRICSARDFREKVCAAGLLQLNPRKHEKTDRPVGIPQGSPISCVLSNLYMLPFDHSIAEEVSKLGGLYRRYSDDIVIILPEEHIAIGEQLLQNKIEDVGLKINPSKSERRKSALEDDHLVIRDAISGSRTSLQYLGVEFDGEQMMLRHAGLARFQRRRSRSIRRLRKWADRTEKPVPTSVLISKFTRRGEGNYLTYVDRAQEKLASSSIANQTSDNRVSKQLKKLLKRSSK